MSVGRPARALSFPRVSASGRATSSRTARCSCTRRGRLTTCIMDIGARTRHTPHQQRRCARPSLLALLLSAHQSVYAGRWWQMACLAMLIHSRGGDASAAPFARRLLSALTPETVGDVSGYLFESEDQKPPLVRRLGKGQPRVACLTRCWLWLGAAARDAARADVQHTDRRLLARGVLARRAARRDREAVTRWCRTGGGPMSPRTTSTTRTETAMAAARAPSPAKGLRFSVSTGSPEETRQIRRWQEGAGSAP